MYSEHLGGSGSTIKRSTYWESLLVSLKMFTHKTLPNMEMKRETSFSYSKIDPVKENEDVMLLGYFQSYKYFEKNFEIICRLIKLNNTKTLLINKYSYDYNAISMHFRLGDYKNLLDHYQILDQNYYASALKFIIENDKTPEKYRQEVLYFCEKQDNDDVEKTILYLENNFPNITFIKVEDSVEDWEQLLLMSCCKHNIIANSSFSWWGAYFNENKDKIVCYPEKWFGPKKSHLSVKDLFPSQWNMIL
jgi:hypothetical protein